LADFTVGCLSVNSLDVCRIQYLAAFGPQQTNRMLYAHPLSSENAADKIRSLKELKAHSKARTPLAKISKLASAPKAHYDRRRKSSVSVLVISDRSIRVKGYGRLSFDVSRAKKPQNASMFRSMLAAV
jgi:hypothetical protein